MRGGDISNDTPGRVIATIDCFIDKEIVERRTLGLFKRAEIEYQYNRAYISRLWHFSANSGVVLELAGFGYSQESMDQVLEDLNNLGTNPFGYAKAFADIDELIAELPYRPELIGVVDIPGNALRYGSKYIDIGRVF
jgi:hypothetical protein